MWFILFLLFPAFADSVEVGSVCDTIEQCGSLMKCRNARCTCDIANANMIPVFIAPGLQTGVLCAEKVKCDYRTSPKKLCTNGHCILEKGEFHGACGCEENQMMTVNSIDNTTCWPYRKKFFNTICGHASPMCDEMKGLICHSSRCLCKEYMRTHSKRNQVSLITKVKITHRICHPRASASDLHTPENREQTSYPQELEFIPHSLRPFETARTS